MNRSRHQARIVALQGLYQCDMQRVADDADIPEMLAPVLSESGLADEAADYARQLVLGAWGQRDRYDRMIAGVSDHWEVSRMGVVDRNILRLALHELVEQPDVPVRVVIDEAIEVGREFGEAETPQFINGVLDAIWKRDTACRIARGEPGEPPVSCEEQESGEGHGTV